MYFYTKQQDLDIHITIWNNIRMDETSAIRTKSIDKPEDYLYITVIRYYHLRVTNADTYLYFKIYPKGHFTSTDVRKFAWNNIGMPQAKRYIRWV